MRRATLWLGCLLAWVPVAVGEESRLLRHSPAAVRQEVIAVIETQLVAIRAGDWAGAMLHAAAPLRARLSAAQFGEMIRRHYPVLWRSEPADYGFVRDNGRLAVVRVHVRSGSERRTYEYRLLREPEGWRIGSVLPVAADDRRPAL
ncbi:MAG: DUF4864 domain-containing protein [Opitutaceae bacterium]|nr:DUF4864 domain-containing protein [Opitutaceae bacterium]